MVDFLHICAVMATCTALLQHMRGNLLYLGQSVGVFLPFSLMWNLLLDFLLDVLASLLDETLPIRQVLLNQRLIVVLGEHVLLDVVVIQILSSSYHRHVCFVLQCLKLRPALELSSPFPSITILLIMWLSLLFLGFSLSTMGVRIDEMRIMMDAFRGMTVLRISLEVH